MNQSSTPNLTPTRPYLVRAIYEWLNDNQLTPYLLVAADLPGVNVPREHVRDGQIVLNIAPHATHQLLMQNDAISFSARFGGVPRSLYIPMSAVLGLYARENSQGMFFDPEEYADQAEAVSTTEAMPTSEEAAQPTPKKSGLRLVD